MSTRLLPLKLRDGTIAAYAIVDAADYEQLAAYVWRPHSKGYAHRRIANGGSVLLHRQIMGLAAGDKREVDHVNLNKLDCRRENMRIVTHAQNGQNVPARPGRSRFRGVSWHVRRGKWEAYIYVRGRQKHLGYHATELDAALRADQARRDLFPFAQPDPQLEQALSELEAAA